MRFGEPSWTVAKVRACEAAGRVARVRAFTEAADGVVVLDSIVRVIVALN